MLGVGCRLKVSASFTCRRFRRLSPRSRSANSSCAQLIRSIFSSKNQQLTAESSRCVQSDAVRPCGGRRPYHFLCGSLLRFIGIVCQCCHALIVPFWRPTTMPTRNVVLSEHQQDFVETLVQSGRYQNASEVLREGLRLVERREQLEAAKPQALQQAAHTGWADVAAGRYTDVPDTRLEDFVGQLGQQAASRV